MSSGQPISGELLRGLYDIGDHKKLQCQNTTLDECSRFRDEDDARVAISTLGLFFEFW